VREHIVDEWQKQVANYSESKFVGAGFAGQISFCMLRYVGNQ